MEISYRLDFPREKARDGRPAEVFRRLPLPASHEVNKRSIFRKEYPMIQMKQAFNTALNKHYSAQKA